MANEKKRILWIDIAKAFAIFLVVVGHTLLVSSPWRAVIFSFHMPLFFIVAGYTFRVKPMNDILSSSLSRLLLPYCLLFVATNAIYLLRAGTFSLDIAGSLVATFIFASGTRFSLLDIDAVGMPWFLMALFFARVVFGFMSSVFEKRGVPFGLQGLFWLVVAFIGICVGSLSEALPFVDAFAEVPRIYLPLSLDIVLVVCFFMFVGYACRRIDFEALLDTWWTFFVAVVIWAVCMRFSYLELAARMYEHWPLALVAACAGTYVCCFVARFVETKLPVMCPPLVWIGQNTMLIFCLHALDYQVLSWRDLPFISMGIPAAHVIAGCVRFVCDAIVAVIVKRA